MFLRSPERTGPWAGWIHLWKFNYRIKPAIFRDYIKPEEHSKFPDYLQTISNQYFGNPVVWSSLMMFDKIKTYHKVEGATKGKTRNWCLSSTHFWWTWRWFISGFTTWQSFVFGCWFTPGIIPGENYALTSNHYRPINPTIILLFQFSTHYYLPSIHQVSIKYPLSIPLSILMHYPLVNKHRPWKSPIFNGFTSLPTPTTARVYVNLPEGINSPWVIHG